MKAIAIEQFGGKEKLKIMDMPIPEPLPGEVQIQIKYTSVNPVDWKIREGYLQTHLPHQFPIILGWDAAGIVTAIGSGVTQFKVGDEVFAYCRKSVVQWGTYAEYICVDASHVAQKPAALSFAQAAAIPLTALTAWQALFEAACLQRGETVLIHAGAGGVGGCAIQFARHIGAIIYTTASAARHDYVKKLGATVAIDYTQADFVDMLKKHHPDGIDVVLDCVGGKTLQDSFAALKPTGRIVSIVDHMESPPADFPHIQPRYVFVRPDGAQLKQIADLLSAYHVVAPTIEEMTLTDAALAQEKNRSGHTKGKIVLKVQGLAGTASK